MVVAEMPIFYFSKLLLTKLGVPLLLMLAHLAYIIRAWGYTLLPRNPRDAWYILLLEPLHGFTFAGTKIENSVSVELALLYC